MYLSSHSSVHRLAVSVSQCAPLSHCLSIRLSICRSVCQSVSQSVSLSVPLCLSAICLLSSLCLTVSQSVSLYFCLFFLSARPSASRSVCLSVPLSFRQLLSHQWRCFLTSLGKQTRCVPSAVENDSQEAQVIPKKSRYTARNS